MESLNCCRTCLGVESLNPIFLIPGKSLDYSQVISVTAGIKVEPTDSLPQALCTECVKFINRSFKFQQLCKTNQNILMERIDNLKEHSIKEELTFSMKCETESAFIDISHLYDVSPEQNYIFENNFDVQCTELEHSYEQDSEGNLTVESQEFSLDCILDKRKTRKSTKICKSTRTSLRSTPKRIERPKKNDLENDKPAEENDSKESEKDTDICASGTERAKKNDLENDKPTEENDLKGSENETDICASGTEIAKESIKCEYCQKVLKSKLSLRNHYKIHTGFDIVCEHCGKRFIARRLLLMHCRARHGYEKTDKCSYCDYRASNAEQVKIHERLHTGEKPFVCEVCSASFHRKSSYLQHRPIHLPDKTVQCEQCPARFKSATLMHIHRNRHRRPQYTFRCYVCRGTFARRRNVIRHLQRIHAILAETQEIERVKIS